MSTAIWGEPESQSDAAYPISLLKYLIRQMMVQFVADGACVALLDESIGQMVMRLHVRLHNTDTPTVDNSLDTDHRHPLPRRVTTKLTDPSLPAFGRLRHATRPLDELAEILPQDSELFPVGMVYPIGQDLIGYVWRTNETTILHHNDYLSSFHSTRQAPFITDVVPTWYLVVPIQESTLAESMRSLGQQPSVLGVIILYQTQAGIGSGFQQRQRAEALYTTERIALYLQNDRLLRQQRRTSDYLQWLQEISTAFPSTVKLSSLVEQVYQFAANVVDVSSLLLTLYDNDTHKIYDVFAIQHRRYVEGLSEQPLVTQPEDRPKWWEATQQEKQTLLLAPTQLEESGYDELLQGAWGDQRNAESFLLLPMKMFNRVIGSLCLSSMQPNAYRPEGIQVLETMVQMITVSIENAKLYDKAHQSLQEAKQREELLAVMNSALQSISSVLNLPELLQKFVESVARLMRAEMCIFFQLSPDKEQLIAQALYAPEVRDNSTPPLRTYKKETAHNLIEMIRIPFKGSLLEHQVSEAFFYLDPPMIEELAQSSQEGGAIFLRETNIQRLLMIPVLYQTELVGILAVHTPKESRFFRPKEIGMLLAICGQAASAIRNAQLFEEIQEANAELQHLNSLKDEFLVTASHELRTPLSAISGYATLLKRQSARINPEQILRFATKISGSSQQLTDLVTNMTEAAKMGSIDKKLELQISPVQIQSAVEMAINMLSITSEQEIVSHIAADVWVKGDPLHVRQVITNLLDNAVKYSLPKGYIEITVSTMQLSALSLPEDQRNTALSAKPEADLPVVVVHVHDEGEGILPEDREKIFEKFVRASRSLTTPIRGSGLGLYICRRYVEAMGGELWIERSVPGEGSIFSFYLPRVEAPPKDTHPVTSNS